MAPVNLVKNLFLLLVSSYAGYLTSGIFGEFYSRIFDASGGFVDVTALIGLPLSYIFFLTLLLTAFGGNKKYWWLGILLIPATAFELYFDFDHLYFPVLIGAVGWGIGFGVGRLAQKV